MQDEEQIRLLNIMIKAVEIMRDHVADLRARIEELEMAAASKEPEHDAP